MGAKNYDTISASDEMSSFDREVMSLITSEGVLARYNELKAAEEDHKVQEADSARSVETELPTTPKRERQPRRSSSGVRWFGDGKHRTRSGLIAAGLILVGTLVGAYNAGIPLEPLVNVIGLNQTALEHQLGEPMVEDWSDCGLELKSTISNGSSGSTQAINGCPIYAALDPVAFGRRELPEVLSGLVEAANLESGTPYKDSFTSDLSIGSRLFRQGSGHWHEHPFGLAKNAEVSIYKVSCSDFCVAESMDRIRGVGLETAGVVSNDGQAQTSVVVIQGRVRNVLEQHLTDTSLEGQVASLELLSVYQTHSPDAYPDFMLPKYVDVVHMLATRGLSMTSGIGSQATVSSGDQTTTSTLLASLGLSAEVSSVVLEPKVLVPNAGGLSLHEPLSEWFAVPKPNEIITRHSGRLVRSIKSGTRYLAGSREHRFTFRVAGVPEAFCHDEFEVIPTNGRGNRFAQVIVLPFGDGHRKFERDVNGMDYCIFSFLGTDPILEDPDEKLEVSFNLQHAHDYGEGRQLWFQLEAGLEVLNLVVAMEDIVLSDLSWLDDESPNLTRHRVSGDIEFVESSTAYLDVDRAELLVFDSEAVTMSCSARKSSVLLSAHFEGEAIYVTAESQYPEDKQRFHLSRTEICTVFAKLRVPVLTPNGQKTLVFPLQFKLHLPKYRNTSD